jgi:hypothetical protein
MATFHRLFQKKLKNRPFAVSGLLVAHHQVVVMYICYSRIRRTARTNCRIYTLRPPSVWFHYSHECVSVLKICHFSSIYEPVPVAARSKASFYGRSPAAIVGSSSTGGMDVCLCVCVVCCQVEVSATSWLLAQRSPTVCGASLCVIKKPREPKGHSPRWAAESEKMIQM